MGRRDEREAADVALARELVDARAAFGAGEAAGAEVAGCSHECTPRSVFGVALREPHTNLGREGGNIVRVQKNTWSSKAHKTRHCRERNIHYVCSRTFFINHHQPH